MTRYIGVRFEDRYREPGCEPFRYDHPTVDVDTDRLAELDRAGDALAVPTDDLLALLDSDGDGGGESTGERIEGAESAGDQRDGVESAGDGRTQLAGEAVATLRERCLRLRDACRTYDIAAIRDDVAEAAELDDRNAVVVPDDVRETVGPERYDALLAYERTRDLVALCDVALDADVALETT